MTYSTERTDFDAAIRAVGPAVVHKGPRHAPAVLVLDPAGEAKHDRLPATWRTLANRVHVVWSRQSALRREGLTEEDLLVSMEPDHHDVHLVGCGPTALPAIALGVRRRDLIASVVLVDPIAAEVERIATAAADLDVPVRQLHTQPGSTAQRAEPPMLIGHPEVVRAVADLVADTTRTG